MTYTLTKGYGFKLDVDLNPPREGDSVNWRMSPSDYWEPVVVPDSVVDSKRTRYVGVRRIDDSLCAVFVGPDGEFYAQTCVNCANP